MNMGTLLDIRNLYVYYRTTRGYIKAVDGVTFKLADHEIMSIVGESGSGKSTLAYALMRLHDPSQVYIRGKVIFNGTDLLSLNEEEMEKIRGSLISIVPQDPNTALNPVYPVGEQIAELFRYKQDLSPKEAKEISIKLMQRVGIPDAEKRYYDYPHQLSGGMKQRIAISIAIALKPKLIIADEPTSALDVTVQARILELLLEVVKEVGSSMLMITHDLGVAAEVSDKICVMYAGKVLEIAQKDEILRRPLHPYTRALLNVVPRFHKSEKRLFPIPGSVPNLLSPPPGCRFYPRCPYRSNTCTKKEPRLIEVLQDHWVACSMWSKLEEVDF